MKKLLKALFKGAATTVSNTTQAATNTDPLAPSQETRDMSMFAKQKNLIEECSLEPVKISSSNFSAWEDKFTGGETNLVKKQQMVEAGLHKELIEQEHEGYMILATSFAEREEIRDRIDAGDVTGLWTVEDYNKKFGPSEPDELEMYEEEFAEKVEDALKELQSKNSTTVEYKVGYDAYATKKEGIDVSVPKTIITKKSE